MIAVSLVLLNSNVHRELLLSSYRNTVSARQLQSAAASVADLCLDRRRFTLTRSCVAHGHVRMNFRRWWFFGVTTRGARGVHRSTREEQRRVVRGRSPQIKVEKRARYARHISRVGFPVRRLRERARKKSRKRKREGEEGRSELGVWQAGHQVLRHSVYDVESLRVGFVDGVLIFGASAGVRATSLDNTLAYR